jgi:putative hydrolase of the HAD superfamily
MRLGRSLAPPVIQPSVRCVLFDAVGTLIYPDPPVAEAYRAAARAFGCELSIEEIGGRFAAALAGTFNADGGATSEARERDRWRDIVGQVFCELPQCSDAIFQRLWEHFAQAANWRVFDDVGVCFAALRQREHRLGIASNFDSRLKNIVAGNETLAVCEHVFVSSEVGYSKPDARFFRAVQERLGAQPGEILLVGDDEVCDVKAARAAGWRTIHLYRRGHMAGSVLSLAELTD